MNARSKETVGVSEARELSSLSCLFARALKQTQLSHQDW